MASFLSFLQKNFEFLQPNLEVGLGADSDKFINIRNKITNDIRAQMHALHKLEVPDANSAVVLIEKDTLTSCLQALARRAAFIGCHHPTEYTSARIASITLVRYGSINALVAVRDFKVYACCLSLTQRIQYSSVQKTMHW